jgi:hypothetical protein
MDTAQKRPESERPMGIEEMLVDIRKRLGRIERDLIALIQGNPPKPRKVPERTVASE